MGYLLIILKTVANLGESVLIKKYNAKHSAGGMFFTGILSVFALIFFVISDRDGFLFPSAMFPFAVAYGLVYCVTYFLTFVAIATGPFTLSMLIISYCLVFPILYGILFLQESVTVFTVLGMLLLMVSLFFVQDKSFERKKKISAKWVVVIIFTTLGNGVLAIIQKEQQIKLNNVCNNEFMMVALAVSAAVLLIGGIIVDRRQLKEILRYGIPYAACAGAANGVNNLLVIFINNLLPLSVVSPLCAGIKILLSFISSTLLFKEKYAKRQLVGVALGVAALAFLNI